MYVRDSHIDTSTASLSHCTSHCTMECAQHLVIHNAEIWWWWCWCWYQAWIQYGTSISPMIQANVLKQMQWPILLVRFWAMAGISTAVLKRLFRIAYNTQNGVVLYGYSLIWVITPVCCSEAVMAAAAAAVCGMWYMIIIVDLIDLVCWILHCVVENCASKN